MHLPQFFSGCLAILLVSLQGAVAADLPSDPLDPAIPEKVVEYLRDFSGVVTRPLPELHPFHTAENEEAPIPPQCYTKTEGHFNPCYVCHQHPVEGRENVMADGHQQLAYNFSDIGETNHWINLFEDRSKAVAAISDAEILAWIDTDNYSALAPALREGGFKGWIPDLKDLQLGPKAFDEHGFARDGSHWVAFNYKPFPSTFWPTNGSTDDVMIRLDVPFRNDEHGNYSVDVYRANLAITEARLKGFARIGCLPVDEAKVGKDLNGDGKLGQISEITQVEAFVGAAADQFNAPYLYPRGTEFLHTVRYIGFDEAGRIAVSRRMKEVRYLRKWQAYRVQKYAREYQLENIAKDRGQLPQYKELGDWGLDNDFGWSVQGFIEGRDGQLRTATYEENLFCMGCHASIGATIDKTFSFARKIDGAEGWGYIDLKGMPDAPSMGEAAGEIATYLERVGGGDEFRNNDEMLARWFTPDGKLDRAKIAAAPDVYTLITPSRERALRLNKAYRTIVAAQDFLYGRDATVTAPRNVYDAIDVETAPTLPESRFFEWDLRLAWPTTGSGSPR